MMSTPSILRRRLHFQTPIFWCFCLQPSLRHWRSQEQAPHIRNHGVGLNACPSISKKRIGQSDLPCSQPDASRPPSLSVWVLVLMHKLRDIWSHIGTVANLETSTTGSQCRIYTLKHPVVSALQCCRVFQFHCDQESVCSANVSTNEATCKADPNVWDGFE